MAVHDLQSVAFPTLDEAQIIEIARFPDGPPYAGPVYLHLLMDRLAEAGYVPVQPREILDASRSPVTFYLPPRWATIHVDRENGSLTSANANGGRDALCPDRRRRGQRDRRGAYSEARRRR